jgi:hypothetical protein
MSWDWISYMQGIGSSSNGGQPGFTAYFDTMYYGDWNNVGSYVNSKNWQWQTDTNGESVP